MDARGRNDTAAAADRIIRRMNKDRARAQRIPQMIVQAAARREPFNADRFMRDPEKWPLAQVMIKQTPDEIRAINTALTSGYDELFARRGGRRLTLTNLSITLVGVLVMGSNCVVRAGMALLGIKSVYTFQAALEVFMEVGSQVAEATINGRCEVRDEEFVTPGGFGRFTDCCGAADTTLVQTCKHPTRIRADWSGKHKRHGKRGLVIVNGKGRVWWVCPRLFAGRHADIYCARKGHMARCLRYVERVRRRYVQRHISIMVDGGFPSLERKLPNLIVPFRRSSGGALTVAQLNHNNELHKVRQIVERFIGRMKKHLDIVGTIYRGALVDLPKIWLIAVWLTDLNIANHPLNAEDDGHGDGSDGSDQPEEIPSEELSDSSLAPPSDSGSESYQGSASG